ncbi:unnamed protein product [Caenorhabditis bovis]|uniref:Uncharacterized protein n=1 Tax=Caenorhabditis bovis TaxID=2654633 RepID=A0A8S1FCF9_9PELO|nr:unnamed protein product [Caenorhabditis bovis]
MSWSNRVYRRMMRTSHLTVTIPDDFWNFERTYPAVNTTYEERVDYLLHQINDSVSYREDIDEYYIQQCPLCEKYNIELRIIETYARNELEHLRHYREGEFWKYIYVVSMSIDILLTKMNKIADYIDEIDSKRYARSRIQI